MSPLDTPLTFRWPRSEAFAAKRGLRRLGSGRLSAYGTLYCPEFTLRDLPRMTVRGQTVQGVGLALRKALLRSRAYPWSTRRPCGPLAFRRATGGSRVQRRVWGVKRGKGTIGALSPLVSAARRRHSHALRGRKVAYSGAPLYRRKDDRLLTVKRKGPYCLRQQLSLRVKQKHRLKVDAFTSGAADEARTRYLHLGKVALYQMSYSRIFRFPVRCSPHQNDIYYINHFACCQHIFSVSPKLFSAGRGQALPCPRSDMLS